MYFWCILFPPLAILMAGKPFQFIISIPLTICMWVPGMIYAFMVVSEYKADERNRQIVNAVSRRR